jgi:hypothetical protein
VNNIASWLSFFSSLRGFHEAELRLMMRNGAPPGTDAGFHVFDVDGRFVLARMLLQGFYLPGRSAISQSTSTSASPRAAPFGSRHVRQIAPLHEADYPAD